MLEGCLHSEQSIKEVDEFYFRKMYFSLEYQEIVEHITKFNISSDHPVGN